MPTVGDGTVGGREGGKNGAEVVGLDGVFDVLLDFDSFVFFDPPPFPFPFPDFDESFFGSFFFGSFADGNFVTFETFTVGDLVRPMLLLVGAFDFGRILDGDFEFDRDGYLDLALKKDGVSLGVGLGAGIVVLGDVVEGATETLLNGEVVVGVAIVGARATGEVVGTFLLTVGLLDVWLSTGAPLKWTVVGENVTLGADEGDFGDFSPLRLLLLATFGAFDDFDLALEKILLLAKRL